MLKAGWVQRPQSMMLGSAVLTCALEQHHIFDWTDEMVQVLPHKALALPLGKVERTEFRMNSNHLYGCFGCVVLDLRDVLGFRLLLGLTTSDKVRMYTRRMVFEFFNTK